MVRCEGDEENKTNGATAEFGGAAGAKVPHAGRVEPERTGRAMRGTWRETDARYIGKDRIAGAVYQGVRAVHHRQSLENPHPAFLSARFRRSGDNCTSHPHLVCGWVSPGRPFPARPVTIPCERRRRSILGKRKGISDHISTALISRTPHTWFHGQLSL